MIKVFEKLPQESDLNYKTSSFLIWQLKRRTGASPATIPHKGNRNKNCSERHEMDDMLAGLSGNGRRTNTEQKLSC
jgi:hypothetical protein